MANFPSSCGSGSDCVVNGDDGWNSSGDKAYYFMGDSNHYISAEWGYGVKIGTAGVGDTIYIKENSGEVGIGQSDPAERLHIGGRLAFDSQDTPTSVPSGKAVMWWDGTELKVMRNVGSVTKTCTITGGWS